MTNLTLGTSAIRELDGLYSLNDLHRAAGGEAKHQPALFLRLDQTQALVTEVHSTDSQSAIRTINGGPKRGTYACRELVIAYAAWISAAFHLKVIRVFLDATVPAKPAHLGSGLKQAIAAAVKEALPAKAADGDLVSMRHIRAMLDTRRMAIVDVLPDLPDPDAEPRCKLPPEVAAALDQKTWALAAEAQRIMRRRIEFSIRSGAEVGYPVRYVYAERALNIIAETTLDEALTPTNGDLLVVARLAETIAAAARGYADAVKAGTSAMTERGILINRITAAGEQP